MEIDKIQQPRPNGEKREIDEEKSDGSANAFEGTELVTDVNSEPEQSGDASKTGDKKQETDDFNAY